MACTCIGSICVCTCIGSVCVCTCIGSICACTCIGSICVCTCIGSICLLVCSLCPDITHPYSYYPPPPPPPPPLHLQLGIKKMDPEGLLQGAKYIVTQNKQLRKELLEIERDVNNLKSENDCLVSV